MDWVMTAKKELRNYELYKKTIDTLSERLAMLETSITSPRISAISTFCSAAPVHGGGNRYDEKMADYIDSADELKRKIRDKKSYIAVIDAAIDALEPCERAVLRRFYVHRDGDYVNDLCRELHFEKSTVYRIKDEALRKFILLMYGVNN